MHSSVTNFLDRRLLSYGVGFFRKYILFELGLVPCQQCFKFILLDVVLQLQQKL